MQIVKYKFRNLRIFSAELAISIKKMSEDIFYHIFYIKYENIFFISILLNLQYLDRHIGSAILNFLTLSPDFHIMCQKT